VLRSPLRKAKAVRHQAGNAAAGWRVPIAGDRLLRDGYLENPSRTANEDCQYPRTLEARRSRPGAPIVRNIGTCQVGSSCTTGSSRGRATLHSRRRREDLRDAPAAMRKLA